MLKYFENHACIIYILKLSMWYLYVEVLNVDYTGIIYMLNMLKVYELFVYICLLYSRGI